MENIVGQQKGTTCQDQNVVRNFLQDYLRWGLTPVPLRRQSKLPLVKWREDDWQPNSSELAAWAEAGVNWAVRCGPGLAALDFDTADSFHSFIQVHPEAARWPRVKTGRGYHLWLKPVKPIRSQTINGVEIKGIGSYVVAPPSIHPTGAIYSFEVAPDGVLPEVDIEQLFNINENLSTVPIIPKKIWMGETDTSVATTEQKGTFGWLFSMLDVYPEGNPTWCPWHPDRQGLPGRIPQRSLSVDWDKCIFKCHSPRCGEHGGLERLGDLVMDETGGTNYPISPLRQVESNSDIPLPEDPPWNQWELEAPPTRHCGMPIHLRHRHHRQVQRIISVLCGRWDCAICGPYLKEKWRGHLTPAIMGGNWVYLSTLLRKEWPTVYRRIRRAGGEFAKIELADGSLAVLTTVKEGISLPLYLREEVLGWAIDGATFQHRAISTSRGWALPKETQKDSDWERVSLLPGTIDDAREVVRQLGLEPKELSTEQLILMEGVRDGFDVKVPESWFEDNERGYQLFLQWLVHGPSRARDGPSVVAVSD